VLVGAVRVGDDELIALRWRLAVRRDTRCAALRIAPGAPVKRCAASFAPVRVFTSSKSTPMFPLSSFTVLPTTT
jgi:hypothetical protein